MWNCNSWYIKIRFYEHNDIYYYDVVYQRKEWFGEIYSTIIKCRAQDNPFTQCEYDYLINTYIREW